MRLPRSSSVSTNWMYLKICLRRFLHVSKRLAHSGLSLTRSFSLLTSFMALFKLEEETDDAAIAWRMVGFSFSRLKALFLFFLSFLILLPSPNVEDGDSVIEFDFCLECDDPVSTTLLDLSLLNSSSCSLMAASSVSLNTLLWSLLCCSVFCDFFDGNWLYNDFAPSRPGNSLEADTHWLNNVRHFAFTSGSDNGSFAAIRNLSCRGASFRSALCNLWPPFCKRPSRMTKALICRWTLPYFNFFLKALATSGGPVACNFTTSSRSGIPE